MFSNVPPNTVNQNCKAANSLFATDYIMLRIDKQASPMEPAHSAVCQPWPHWTLSTQTFVPLTWVVAA